MKTLRILALVPVLATLISLLARPSAQTQAALSAPVANPTPQQAAADASSAPAWSHDVAPIVYAHCSSCHHPGGAGPFNLLTYTDAKRWAPQILKVTQSRFMPPWLPEPGYGDFADVRRLNDDDRALLKRWIDSGMAPGDLTTAPPAPSYDSSWQIGKPDLVLKVAAPYTLPPGGTDVFRNFILPYPLKETHYIRAMEIRPGAPQVVHHANVLVDRTGAMRHQHPNDWQAGIPGMELFVDAGNTFDPDSHFLFWKPDTPALIEPEGMPWRLDPGNDLILNIHLKPSGKPETLDAQVGLYFTPDPPKKQPMLIALERDDQLDIPAGDASFVVEDSLTLPVDVEVLGVYPHAHYLGHDMQGWAILPNGEKKWLVWIKDWDIDRQSVYRYRQPLVLPKGTELHMHYTYDNSASNPHNPHIPPVRVRAGNRSEDEMSHLWLQVLPINTPPDAPDPRLMLEEAWMRKRLAKTPTDQVTLYNLASALAGQGKYTGAAADFEQEPRSAPPIHAPSQPLARPSKALASPIRQPIAIAVPSLTPPAPTAHPATRVSTSPASTFAPHPTPMPKRNSAISSPPAPKMLRPAACLAQPCSARSAKTTPSASFIAPSNSMPQTSRPSTTSACLASMPAIPLLPLPSFKLHCVPGRPRLTRIRSSPSPTPNKIASPTLLPNSAPPRNSRPTTPPFTPRSLSSSAPSANPKKPSRNRSAPCKSTRRMPMAGTTSASCSPVEARQPPRVPPTSAHSRSSPITPRPKPTSPACRPRTDPSEVGAFLLSSSWSYCCEATSPRPPQPVRLQSLH